MTENLNIINNHHEHEGIAQGVRKRSDSSQVNYSGPKSKLLNDAIHGQISLDEELFRIIDTPIFQRLRDLKQLGGMYYVFPGASHNRFEHCLGTCYLAGEWMKHFKHYGAAATDRDVFLVQVAALVHDLGHGPFSHTFQDIFVAQQKIDWEHEEASCALLELINEDIKLLAKEEVEIVKSLILGDDSRAPQEKKFMWQIVANKVNSIDVDKFDYISRDCHGANLPKGFEFKRTMELSRVIDGDICFHVKESYNILQLFQTRYSLHKQIYSHRVTKAIELMIGDILSTSDEVFGITKILRVHDLMERNWQEYCLLTDSLLKEIERSKDPRLEEARKILKKLLSREIYKWVVEAPIAKDYTQNAEKYKSDLDHFLEQEGLGKYAVVVIAKFNFAMKKENPLTRVKFYREWPSNHKPQSEPAELISGLMPNNFEEAHIRVYSKEKSRQGDIISTVTRWAQESDFSRQIGKPTCSPKAKTVGPSSQQQLLREKSNIDFHVGSM